MNTARQISRRIGRATGARTRSAVDYCITATVSMKSDPLKFEKRFFAMCDKILVHCENMKEFFVRHSVPAAKLQIFEAFDYLTGMPMNPLTAEHMNTVNICGNLSPHKCGCYKDLKTIKGVDWCLYGPNFNLAYAADNVKHMGEFPPDVLPGQFKYGWGLIWDGDSAETQTGLFGLYQMINHPHKLSLCLSSGLPVIVWAKSGVADFIVKNRIGFTISSLQNVPRMVKSVSLSEYAMLRKGAMAMGCELRDGKIVKRALEVALQTR